jgi:hypothetical protein
MDALKETTCAYLAGLIDADGSITIEGRNYKHTTNKGYRVKICVYNCRQKIIDYLIDTIGGSNRSNNINRSHAKWRDCIEYKLLDNQAIKLIEGILPYLIIKKKQALIALEADKINKQFSSSDKRWHLELKVECDTKISLLKTQINALNFRGTQKQFEQTDISTIPFDLNYVAGFCDADGSLMIVKGGKQIVAKLSITNTDKNVIDWMMYHLGGSLCVKRWKNKKWNTGYQLIFTSQKAYDLAEKLCPLLILKKQQAKLLIALGNIKREYDPITLRWNPKLGTEQRRKQEQLKLECSLLNKRST